MRRRLLLLAALLAATGALGVNPLDIDEPKALVTAAALAVGAEGGGEAPGLLAEKIGGEEATGLLETKIGGEEAAGLLETKVRGEEATGLLGGKNATSEEEAEALMALAEAEKGHGSTRGAEEPELSIDEVAEHVQLLQQLELTLAKSLAEMSKPSAAAANNQLREQLQAVQEKLQRLAVGLNGTLEELEHVERDTEEQSKKLREVLEQQKEEEQEQFIEKNGMKAVDYETGRLRNTTGLSEEQLKKLEEVEKKADPAVLHYDFDLLGQIAVLLGVSAIGGIIATYFNIPPHVGYLLGGALVGPSCFGFVRQYKEVETISLFGSIFLLFGHGAGYTPQHPDDVLKRYFIAGMAYIGLTVTFVALMSVYIGWSSSFLEGMIVGIAVCFTTTAPLSEHIRSNQIQDSSYGRMLTAIIAVQDILMSFCLGTPEWFSSRSYGWIGVAMVRSIIAYAAVVAMVVSLHVYVVPRLLRFLTAMEEVHRSPLVLLGVVSVCLTMALFTEMIGLSLECGAFLAGLAFVNVSADAKGAFTSIRVMENLFGSMFFACVGMILNPMFLLKNAGEILSMVILIIAIKFLSMTVVMASLRISIRRALVAAVGLSQIGELALIFMIKAHHTDLVSRRIYLLFVAAISVFLGCSSIFDRQVVLARRKNIFRLPSIMSRGPASLSRSVSGPATSKSHSKMFPVSFVAVPVRDRASSSIGDINDFNDSGGEGDDLFSPPTSPRRHPARHRVV